MLVGISHVRQVGELGRSTRPWSIQHFAPSSYLHFRFLAGISSRFSHMGKKPTKVGATTNPRGSLTHDWLAPLIQLFFVRRKIWKIESPKNPVPSFSKPNQASDKDNLDKLLSVVLTSLIDSCHQSTRINWRFRAMRFPLGLRELWAQILFRVHRLHGDSTSHGHETISVKLKTWHLWEMVSRLCSALSMVSQCWEWWEWRRRGKCKWNETNKRVQKCVSYFVHAPNCDIHMFVIACRLW